MNTSTEKDSVIDAVNRLFIATDNRNWKEVESLFTQNVLFDMESVTGGQPSVITRREIVDGWVRGLKALKAVHHQSGNFLVDMTANEADVFCYGTAWHYLPNKSNRNTRVFVGSYDIHLVRKEAEWRIDRFKYNLKFIDGNVELERSVAAASAESAQSDEAA